MRRRPSPTAPIVAASTDSPAGVVRRHKRRKRHRSSTWRRRSTKHGRPQRSAAKGWPRVTPIVAVVVTAPAGRVEYGQGLLVVPGHRGRIVHPTPTLVRVGLRRRARRRRRRFDTERFGRRPRHQGGPRIVVIQLLGIVTYFALFELAARRNGSHGGSSVISGCKKRSGETFYQNLRKHLRSWETSVGAAILADCGVRLHF